MPQIWPMNWIMILLYIMLNFYIFLIFNYFSIYTSLSKLEDSSIQKKSNFKSWVW